MDETFTAIETDEGVRVDKFLAIHSIHSRERFRELFDAGLVSVNGNVVKPSYHIKVGDVVSANVPADVPIDLVPEDLPLKIVYQDEWLAVVDKPQGVTVHPVGSIVSGTLVNALLFHLDQLSTINGVIRPGIVHRIDRDTSGLLVVAKNDIAHHFLADQFAAHTNRREYRAFVHGNFENVGGVIETNIDRDPFDHKKMTVVPPPTGKTAYTTYEVLNQYDGYALIKAVLRTGRTHQIRVHMKYISHPVVGDKLYSTNNALDRQFIGQLLHACTLGFIHPYTKEELLFESDLPPYFEILL
jgi:23S rRNA pseudouridine1911/1915/1917 synthase